MRLDRLSFIQAAEIIKTFDSPVFVIDEAAFRDSIRGFVRRFQVPRHPVEVAYSYKTNNVLAVCAIARDEGLSAEVVTEHELSLADSLGIPGEKIIYNGPQKSEASLIRAMELGAHIHIDSFEEADKIAKLAHASRPARVGIRLTSNIGEMPWDKFGFDVPSGEADRVCRLICNASNVRLSGLHMHIGTNITSIDSYRQALRTLTGFATHLHSEFGIDLDYLDIGGGFSSPAGGVPTVVHPEEWLPIDLSACGRAISEELDNAGIPENVAIVTEPGRALVETVAYLLTRVLHAKVRGDRKLVVIDCGCNFLPTAYYTKHTVVAIGQETSEGNLEMVDIHGPLCTQYDLVAPAALVPPLKSGDILAVKAVGAYALAFSCQFVSPRPAVVLHLAEDGSYECVRKAETTADMWRNDIVPSRL